LRFRASLMERSIASVSWRIFSPSEPPMSWPLLSMGVAAPMRAPSAITATCAARVMYVPALAARLPDGPTQTITGTGADRSV
jgi:hypothetical protein